MHLWMEKLNKTSDFVINLNKLYLNTISLKFRINDNVINSDKDEQRDIYCGLIEVRSLMTWQG